MIFKVKKKISNSKSIVKIESYFIFQILLVALIREISAKERDMKFNVYKTYAPMDKSDAKYQLDEPNKKESHDDYGKRSDYYGENNDYEDESGRNGQINNNYGKLFR